MITGSESEGQVGVVCMDNKTARSTPSWSGR